MKENNSSYGTVPQRWHPQAPAKATVSSKTVDNALNILDFLGVFGGQVGIREMADHLGINRSSTHRLLVTLERHGYVAQDPNTGKYQLGIRIFEAGAVVLSQMRLRSVAAPHLQRLAIETGEVVHLGVENGNQCLYIDKMSGKNAISMGSQLGWRRPLYCTGIGKALLAGMPESRIEDYLQTTELLPYTPNTIVAPIHLRRELEEIRLTGIAHDKEEIEIGLSCVAAPILGINGEIVGAISIAGPSTRFEAESVARLEALILATARAVSSDIEASSHLSATAE